MNKNKKVLRKAKVKKYKLLRENFSPQAWAALLLAFDVVPLEQLQHVVTSAPAEAVKVIEKLKIRELEISTVGIKVSKDA